MTRPARTCSGVLAALGLALPGAHAQSLFLADSPVVRDADGNVDEYAELRATSLLLVEPPPPPPFEVHDIIYVIIDERTTASSSQTLETSKEFEKDDQINSVLDPTELLEARLRAGALTNLSLIDIEAETEFTGEGEYDRSDRVQARIAATVLDVKPNGTLVLEARKTVRTDEEVRVVVLTGTARGDDITAQNTVLSSQLADLAVTLEHSGELKKAAKKGVFTRVIETLFAF